MQHGITVSCLPHERDARGSRNDRQARTSDLLITNRCHDRLLERGWGPDGASHVAACTLSTIYLSLSKPTFARVTESSLASES